MIIDTIKNAPKYFAIHPLFAKAFEYINQNDLAAMPDGKSDISEGLKAIASNAPAKQPKPALPNLSVMIRT